MYISGCDLTLDLKIDCKVYCNCSAIKETVHTKCERNCEEKISKKLSHSYPVTTKCPFLSLRDAIKKGSCAHKSGIQHLSEGEQHPPTRHVTRACWEL